VCVFFSRKKKKKKKKEKKKKEKEAEKFVLTSFVWQDDVAIWQEERAEAAQHC
jgi:hypothetical protein